MKVACHQPNFVPYLGYFEKMNKADVFTLSDSVLYSRKAFFNYNTIFDGKNELRLTVPASAHMDNKLNEIKLVDWDFNRRRIIKSLQHFYAKATFFNHVMPKLVSKLSQEFIYVADLNIELIKFIKDELEIDCRLVRESTLGIDFGDKNQDIVKICKKLGADTYVSGEGGKEYLDLNLFESNGIKVEFSSSDYPKYSVLDYLFRNGGGNPWRKN